MNQENANEIKTLRFSSLNRKCNKFNGLRIFMHQSQAKAFSSFRLHEIRKTQIAHHSR
jgi:hypothetical protein